MRESGSDDVSAAWDEGDELAGSVAEDVACQRCCRDCKPHRQKRLGRVAVDEELAYRNEDEYVYQVHSERKPAYVSNKSWSGWSFNASEQYECTEGCQQYVRGAEFPCIFYQRKRQRFSDRCHAPV